MNHLLDSQISAIDKLSRYKVGALFMEPGTGKTRSAIELIKSTPVESVIWATPFRTKDNLKMEIDKWGGIGNRKLVIIGIETISSSDRWYLQLTKLLNESNTMLIVDESLKIKNSNAIRTYRFIELSKLCEYKLILNGTPLSRNLLDLWSQMQFLSPKILNMDEAEFKNTFCEYVKVTKHIGYRKIEREIIKDYHNIDYLYSLIGHYVYEADLRLNITKQYIDIDFKLDPDTKQEYEYLKEEYLNNEKLQWLNNNFFLELTQKMQHLYTNSKEKYEILDSLINESNIDKVIVFRKYLSAESELRSRYPKLKVLSIQSESFGLNLQNYDTIIIWDKVWDYALLKQMEHRIYRTGQINTCKFINLNGNVNLESLIQKCINKKQSLLEYIKNKALNNLIQEL